MIGTQLSYQAPDTLKGALDLIGREGHQVLTADQSLLNARKQSPVTLHTLVSLRKVPGLATIRHESGQLFIGASASYYDLLHHPALASYPVLAQAVASIQDPHLLHNCTLGGALHYGGSMHAPIVAALMALDGQTVVLSRTDDVRLPIQSFSQQGQRVPFLPGKLLTTVVVPATHLPTGGYLPLEQLPGRKQPQGVAVTLSYSDQAVAEARLVLAGFTEQPVRLTAVENALVGEPLSPDRIVNAADLIDETSLPVQNANVPEGYYQHLAKVLTRRALTKLSS